MNFNNKNVVILGGLGGLGTAICQELIRNGLKVSLSHILKLLNVLKCTFHKEFGGN